MRMTLLAVLCCGLAACHSQIGGTAPAATEPGEVAIEISNGGSAVVVPARINGQGPFNLVLDTGATMTCVDQALAAKLELQPQSEMLGQGFGVSAQGNVGLVTVNRIDVGSASADSLTACVLDLKSLRGAGLEVHGLLGLNFLREFRMTLDFDRKILRLERPPVS
jgi:predicted aspartyl protease